MSLSAPASWAGYPKTRSEILSLHRPGLPEAKAPLLAYGNGRSYGDVGLNDGGTLLYTRGLDRFVELDEERGVLRCEAGVLLGEILALIVPRGWFLPVCPGTRFVTVGGAIANDVHGKNHHRNGSFGCHVLSFELYRSDGQRLRCAPDENADWFAATIGGLGLTGLIVHAELQLMRVPSPMFRQREQRYANLDEFFELSARAEADWDYSAAWLDCLASGKALGRGIFLAGNHAAPGVPQQLAPRRLAVPFAPPFSFVNWLSLRAFNKVYYRRAPVKPRESFLHHEPFLFPLDAIENWNRLYGRRGFLQYQCVIPRGAEAAVRELLSAISRRGIGSFLVVLKVFGERRSPGWLSFPRPGVTLAVDFPGTSAETMKLLNVLDDIVLAANGAVYPAKDARMSPAVFARGYPALERFEAYRDPAFSSSMWRRLRA